MQTAKIIQAMRYFASQQKFRHLIYNAGKSPTSTSGEIASDCRPLHMEEHGKTHYMD